MVVVYEELHAPRLSVYVNSSRPFAWREKPFYDEIKRWASAAVAARGQVIVWQGRTAIAVMPDRDKDLGQVRPDQFIITSAQPSLRGTALDVFVVDRTDPLVQTLGLGSS